MLSLTIVLLYCPPGIRAAHDGGSFVAIVQPTPATRTLAAPWCARAATAEPHGATAVARAGRDGTAPHDLDAPLRHQPDGLGEQTVFLLKDARAERLDCVVIMHRHGGLEHDGPAVHLCRHQMHGAPADLHAMGQSRL